jgi:hypothetical protein
MSSSGSSKTAKMECVEVGAWSESTGVKARTVAGLRFRRSQGL